VLLTVTADWTARPAVIRAIERDRAATHYAVLGALLATR
jgi:hypothetical protein